MTIDSTFDLDDFPPASIAAKQSLLPARKSPRLFFASSMQM
jgi:hypothetical protein